MRLRPWGLGGRRLTSLPLTCPHVVGRMGHTHLWVLESHLDPGLGVWFSWPGSGAGLSTAELPEGHQWHWSWQIKAPCRRQTSMGATVRVPWGKPVWTARAPARQRGPALPWPLLLLIQRRTEDGHTCSPLSSPASWGIISSRRGDHNPSLGRVASRGAGCPCSAVWPRGQADIPSCATTAQRPAREGTAVSPAAAVGDAGNCGSRLAVT